MKSSDLKVATHADIANIRYCFFCQPGGVPHTLAVRANWLNVHAGIMYRYSIPDAKTFIYLIEQCMGIQWGIQYLLVNIVWDTASTGIYVGTAFPGLGGYVIR